MDAGYIALGTAVIGLTTALAGLVTAVLNRRSLQKKPKSVPRGTGNSLKEKGNRFKKIPGMFDAAVGNSLTGTKIDVFCLTAVDHDHIHPSNLARILKKS